MTAWPPDGWLLPLVAAPLAGALLAIVWARRCHVVGLAALTALALGAAALIVLVGDGGEVRVELGGWMAPLGIELRADGFAAAMIALTAVVAGVLGASAGAYFDVSALRSFWPLWLFLSTALVSLFLSGDVFNLYVTLELLSLSAVGLVALASGRLAIGAAFQYLIASLAGSLAYLLGVALLYGEYGVLDLAALATRIEPSATSGVAAALMTTGLLLKGALFPLHFWLPAAHASAPAPVSAALSALVVKGPAYILVRLWVDVFPAADWVRSLDLIAVLGALAVAWGAAQALRAARLKLVIAYSTVAQLGYFGLMLPAAALDGAGSAAWSSLPLFFVAHGLAKAALFSGAGAVLRGVGDDRMDGLANAAARLPAAFIAMGLAAISLVGLPPSGGFVAKWLMLASAIEQARWLTAAVLAAATLLSGGYLLRVLAPAFSGAVPEATAPVEAGARTLAAAGVLLALASLALGALAAPALSMLAP